jgi:hypothetical protein
MRARCIPSGCQSTAGGAPSVSDEAAWRRRLDVRAPAPAKLGSVTDPRQRLAHRLENIAGLARGESLFRHGAAYWVNGKEVAHFEDDRTVVIRLSRAVIRDRRTALKADHASASDPAELTGSPSASTHANQRSGHRSTPRKRNA